MPLQPETEPAVARCLSTAASDVTTEDEDAASDVTGGAASDVTGGQLEREQERFRRLFGVFDSNQDGFLDRWDLERMCRQLGLDEQAVPLILSQLGADQLGQLSCDDFLRAWIELRTEVERLRQPAAALTGPQAGTDGQTQLTQTDTPIGDCVSWSSGVTSGDPADPALQPDSLVSLLERAGHDTTGEPPELLSAADQLHQAAVGALRSELAVSAARLAQLTEENGQLQKSLNRTLRERSRGERSAAERYEQRLVELHSVIAELTRKLQRQRAAAIAEEDEDEDEEREDSEDSREEEREPPPSDGPASDPEAVQTEEATGRPPESAENAQLSTEPAHCGLEGPLGAIHTSVQHANTEAEAAETASSDRRRTAADSADKACQMTEPEPEPDTEPEPEPESEREPEPERQRQPPAADSGRASPVPAGAARSASGTPPPAQTGRRHTLEREIYGLVKENDRLQERLGRQEAEMNQCRVSTENAAEERDRLRRQVLEYQRAVECASPRSGRSAGSAGAVGASPQTAHTTPVAVSRMAERVRLRQAGCGGTVTGSDISACGVQSTRLAEYLVQGYQGACTAAEEALLSAGAGGGAGGGAAAAVQERLALAELECERVRARLEHAQSQVDVLTLSLEAACAQSEHLAALCGKYESNCVALQLAAEAGDQLTEAFDLLVALQDSERALLLAGWRAAGLGPTASRAPSADAETALRVASEQRRSCENVARHALSRLERRAAAVAAAYSEDGSQNASTTSSSSSGVDVDVSRSDESRVREHIQRLKVERALVAGTAVQLESTCHTPPPPRPLSPAAAQRLDLEHAVLVQELMALREERAELRARLFLVERERAGLELKLASSAASETAYRLQLEQLRPHPQPQHPQHPHPAEDDRHQASDEDDDRGSSPGGRQAALRSQLGQLSASLDEVTRTAEQRQQHADQFIAELKRANGALADALEKTKRKYQAKLKRLEQQMLQIVERHSNQHRQQPQPQPQPQSQSAAALAQQLQQQQAQSPPPPLPPSRPSPAAVPPASPSVRPCVPPGSRLPIMSPAHRSPLSAGRRPSPSTPKRTAPLPPPLSARPPHAAGPR